MISTILNLVLAVAQVFPIVKGWLEQLVLLYIQSEVARMKEENKVALVHAITQKCQIELERIGGYRFAGKPSGIDGTIIVGELPNVGVVQHADPKASGSEPVAQQQPDSP
jgi:hypothetical protein